MPTPTPNSAHPTPPSTQSLELARYATGLAGGSNVELALHLSGLGTDHEDLLRTVVERLLAYWEQEPCDAFLEEGGGVYWPIARELVDETDARALVAACAGWNTLGFGAIDPAPGFDFDDVQMNLPDWPGLDDVAPHVVADVLATIAHHLLVIMAGRFTDWVRRLWGARYADVVRRRLEANWSGTLTALLTDAPPTSSTSPSAPVICADV